MLFAAFILVSALTLAPIAQTEASGGAVAPEVHHALVTLPFYSVFDYLDCRTEGNNMALFGEVTRVTLKNDAERAAMHAAGARHVVNQIEVLPLSASDQKRRLAEYLTVYGDAILDEEQQRNTPSIHIVVKNGAVTLEGTVSNEMEKTEAFTQASKVPGVVSLTNHLRVEQ